MQRKFGRFMLNFNIKLQLKSFILFPKAHHARESLGQQELTWKDDSREPKASVSPTSNLVKLSVFLLLFRKTVFRFLFFFLEKHCFTLKRNNKKVHLFSHIYLPRADASRNKQTTYTMTLRNTKVSELQTVSNTSF